jgi:hypothetical protein
VIWAQPSCIGDSFKRRIGPRRGEITVAHADSHVNQGDGFASSRAPRAASLLGSERGEPGTDFTDLGHHLTQRSKLGRDVRSEAIDWTHLTRQQVLCLASGVSPRRSDEGYEKANCRLAHALVGGWTCQSTVGPGRLSNESRGFRRLATRAHLSVDSRRRDPSWIPGFPFGHLPSDRPEAPIALFEMPELGTMLRSPAPSLRLEALVE